MTRNLDLAQLVLVAVRALLFFLRKFNLKKECAFFYKEKLMDEKKIRS
jgi:hypothetical protein